MNSLNTFSRVALIVTNPQALRLGSLPRHHFDRHGGFIGSRDADWSLDDGRRSVSPLHCQILWDDGAFCLVDRSGETRINDNPAPLGRDVSVRLAQGDHIQIGPFRVAVHLEQAHRHLPDPDRHLAEHSIEELLCAEHGDAADRDGLPHRPGERHPFPCSDSPDALAALIQTPEPAVLDPLLALERAQAMRASVPDSSFSTAIASAGQAPPALEAVLASAPSSTFGDDRMSRYDFSRSPVLPPSSSDEPGETQAPLGPLLEGLGLSTADVDSARLMFDSGQAIRAFVQGLLALRSNTHDGNRLGPQSRTLQPIEDNPLHLGQSCDDTLRALFSSQRSQVHLSPKAAVEESLDELGRHQYAIQQGIEAGLNALLQAFAPEQLLQRFHRYQPAADAPAQPDDWAWQMYTHYYRELRSNRQRGFAKLFWEVFEQHVDRAMRAEA